MYKVLHYEDHTDLTPKVIHNPYSNREDNVLYSGKLYLGYNETDRFDFTVDLANLIYNGVHPLKSIIEIINVKIKKTVFKGRVLRPKSKLNEAVYYQNFTSESLMGYLNDSVQAYAKIPNTGDLRPLFEKIINVHNSQVEEHKRFKIGSVTVQSDSDIPYRYLDYEKTMHVIQDVLIGQIGGVIRLRYEDDGNYLDWLEDYGEIKQTRLMPKDNLISASRETNFEDIITRLVPVGATLNTDSGNNDSNATHQRVTIESVNSGKNYLDDPELIKHFGIIGGKADWSDIDDPALLKLRGQQFLNTQKAILTSWQTVVEERAWTDSRFEFLEVGNLHPIDSDKIGPEETLKIVGMTIDINNPETVDLEIGDSHLTLSGYQNMLRESDRSIQKLKLEAQIENARRAQIESELSTLRGQLSSTDLSNSELITALEERIAQLEEQLNTTGG